MILPFDAVFCLNIAENKDRLEYFKSEMKKHNVNNNIIYTKFTKLDLFYSYDNLINTIKNDKLGDFNRSSNKTIINSLSHLINVYQIIKYSYENDFDTICVFEDDVVINDIELFRKYIYNLPNDYDIIRLGISDWYDFSKDENMFNKKDGQFITGTLCFVMNKKGMKSFIDYANENITYTDFVFTELYNLCNVYYVKDKIICEQNIKSSINI